MSFEKWLAEFHPEIDISTLGQGVPTQNLVAEYERFLAGDESKFISDPDESFEEWLARVHPKIDFDSLGIEGKNALRDEYQGRDPDEEVVVDEPVIKSDSDAYDAYQAAGGKASFNAWLSIGKPKTPADEPPGSKRREAPKVFQNDDGLWVDPLTGTTWLTQGEALASFNAETQSRGFKQDLEQSIIDFQESIGELTADQAAEARRLNARNVGKISTEARNALLARGVDPGEIEQRLAGGFEGSARSLRDLETQIGLQGQQALAGAEQFGIQGQLTAESLAQAQQGLITGQSQFQQSLAESVRQFGAGQSQQQSQFEAGLGFSQQQLGQQAGQFGRTLRQQQRQANPFSSFGNFFGSVADAFSFSF